MESPTRMVNYARSVSSCCEYMWVPRILKTQTLRKDSTLAGLRGWSLLWLALPMVESFLVTRWMEDSMRFWPCVTLTGDGSGGVWEGCIDNKSYACADRAMERLTWFELRLTGPPPRPSSSLTSSITIERWVFHSCQLDETDGWYPWNQIHWASV
jgi:hypothetical protein